MRTLKSIPVYPRLWWQYWIPSHQLLHCTERMTKTRKSKSRGTWNFQGERRENGPSPLSFLIKWHRWLAVVWTRNLYTRQTPFVGCIYLYNVLWVKWLFLMGSSGEPLASATTPKSFICSAWFCCIQHKCTNASAFEFGRFLPVWEGMSSPNEIELVIA